MSDEDIIGSNMTMPTTSIPKNYLHGSREGLIAYGKHGRLMKLIGDQIQVFLTSSTRPPRRFGSKDRKSPSTTRFGS